MTSIEMLKNYFGKDENEFIFKEAEKLYNQEIIYFARHCLNKAKDTDILTVFINTQQYYQETFKKD
jgi:hypothetical protein